MNDAERTYLCERIAAHGIEATDEQIGKTHAWLRLLDRWGRIHNLTGVRGFEQRVDTLVLDSLAAREFLRPSDILDLGSGAGVPGIPLAIFAPEHCGHRYTLIDGSGKKAQFMERCVSELALPNVTVLHTRAEYHRYGEGGNGKDLNYGQDDNQSDRQGGVRRKTSGSKDGSNASYKGARKDASYSVGYDTIIARGAGANNEILKYSMHLAKKTTRWIVFKPARPNNEPPIDDAVLSIRHVRSPMRRESLTLALLEARPTLTASAKAAMRNR